MSIKQARAMIENAIRVNGEFSHNVCSTVLRGVAESMGIAEANQLVSNYGLKQLYGIEEVTA